LRHVALDNGIQFGGLFSERLITDALRGLGVKASRCNYAQVYLNEQCAGVYVNVERIDQSFLERHFATGDGVLFKVDEGGPGADLRYLGGDPTIYRKSFELHAGDEEDAFDSLLDFIRALNSPADEFKDLSKCLDVNALVKTTAVMLFAGAFDQYTGWGPHHYFRALYRQIQSALKEDPYPPRRVTVPSDSGFEDVVSSMETFIRARYALARAQLDSPGRRPAPRPMPSAPEPEGPKPGPSSADAPSDLHAVKVTAASVELGWTDHAQGEVAFVVQRCTGAECTDFTNTIGQGGQDITTAIDRDVQPGKTYCYRVYAVLPTPKGPGGRGFPVPSQSPSPRTNERENDGRWQCHDSNRYENESTRSSSRDHRHQPVGGTTHPRGV